MYIIDNTDIKTVHVDIEIMFQNALMILHIVKPMFLRCHSPTKYS